MKELQWFDDDTLVQGYLAEAAWYWFDASTLEKSLEAGLHRVVARCILEELHQRGLPEPSADRIYAHARRLFPRDDLRRRHSRSGAV